MGCAGRAIGHGRLRPEQQRCVRASASAMTSATTSRSTKMTRRLRAVRVLGGRRLTAGARQRGRSLCRDRAGDDGLGAHGGGYIAPDDRSQVRQHVAVLEPGRERHRRVPDPLWRSEGDDARRLAAAESRVDAQHLGQQQDGDRGQPVPRSHRSEHLRSVVRVVFRRGIAGQSRALLQGHRNVRPDDPGNWPVLGQPVRTRRQRRDRPVRHQHRDLRPEQPG